MATDQLKWVGTLKDELPADVFDKVLSRAIKNMAAPPERGGEGEAVCIYHYVRTKCDGADIPFTVVDFARAHRMRRITL